MKSESAETLVVILISALSTRNEDTSEIPLSLNTTSPPQSCVANLLCVSSTTTRASLMLR